MIKWLSRYLLLSGLAAHLLVIAVWVHFNSTGLTPHRYASKGIQVLDSDSSPTRHVARFARLVLLDSGLLADPVAEYPPELRIALPQWRGMGANALRTDTAPRYHPDGQPIASTDRNLWTLVTPPRLRSISVDSVDSLKAALRNAQPGDAIVLKPGHYRLHERISLAIDGTAERPLLLRGEGIANTVLELQDGGSLDVSGRFWNISDLIVRGQCERAPCSHLIDVAQSAEAFTVRNLFASSLQSLLQTMPGGEPITSGLVDGVTLIGGRVATAALSWPQHAVREIPVPSGSGKFKVLCTRKDSAPDCDSDNLAQSVKQIAEGGLLLIRSGRYQQAATLRKRDLHIVAEPGAALYKKNVQGKGALVVNANVTIEGLECSHVSAGDGNGCCVRQERGDVTLIGVHIHHSQMGMLTGHNGGSIRIFDSYFHDSGYDESGQLGHNIYVNSGELEFIRSWSLSARNAGHELKTRAARSVIADSLIASVNARDSRLIDAPNAGVLDVRSSVLGEGPRSENWDVIGYGLELRNGRPVHPTNSVTIRGNTFYIDRPQGGKLLNAEHAASIDFSDNVVIGDASTPSGNTHFSSRRQAAAPAYPALTAQHF